MPKLKKEEIDEDERKKLALDAKVETKCNREYYEKNIDDVIFEAC